MKSRNDVGVGAVDDGEVLLVGRAGVTNSPGKLSVDVLVRNLTRVESALTGTWPASFLAWSWLRDAWAVQIIMDIIEACQPLKD